MGTAEIIESQRLVTRPEAARYLGLREQTLAKWAMSGANLPVVKTGARAVRYKLTDLQQFVEERTTPAT